MRQGRNSRVLKTQTRELGPWGFVEWLQRLPQPPARVQLAVPPAPKCEWNSPGSFLGLDRNPQFIQLIRLDLAWRFRHHVNRGGCLRERNHVANRLLAGEQHHHAVDTKRDPAMRWRPIRQRVEKKTESPARLFVRQAEGLKHPRLHVLPMNSDAARTQLHAVQHDIVALRPAIPGRRLELLQIFLDDPRERMLRAHPALLRLAPLEKREAGDPRELPFAAVNQFQSIAEVKTNLPRHAE